MQAKVVTERAGDTFEEYEDRGPMRLRLPVDDFESMVQRGSIGGVKLG